MDSFYDNPFIGFGQPITSPRLFGQERLIQKIQRNLLNGSSSFLVGLPRSGKTSIAKEVLKGIKNENSNITCTTIFFSAVTNESDFYHDIAHDLFPDCNIFDGENDAGKKFDLFRYHLKEQCEKGFSGIVVIDEFDSILSEKFVDRFLLINQLCELISYRDSYHLTFLFLSSRSLFSFSNSTSSESGLTGLCPQFYMKMLSKADVEELLHRVDIDDPQIKDTVFKITGGHPYLTEALLYHSLDYAEEKQLPFSSKLIKTVRKLDDCSSVFGQYYACIKKQLSLWGDLKLWDNLCNLTIGPLLQPPSESVSKILEHYGLIDEHAICFSNDFHDFLSNQVRSVPLWDSISEVEKMLRKFVKARFEQKFKKDWVKKLKEKDEFYVTLFEGLEKIMIRDQNPVATSSDILEYSYFDDMKAIISHNWEWFKDVFVDSKNIFCERIEKIGKIRNSVAHNRPPQFIPEADQILAQNACQELCRQLNTWEENKK